MNIIYFGWTGGQEGRLRFIFLLNLWATGWIGISPSCRLWCPVHCKCILCSTYTVQYENIPVSYIMFIVVIWFQLWPLCSDETWECHGMVGEGEARLAKCWEGCWLLQNTARLTFDRLDTLALTQEMTSPCVLLSEIFWTLNILPRHWLQLTRNWSKLKCLTIGWIITFSKLL